MADHQGPEPREPGSPGGRHGADADRHAGDLAAALGDLDRATRQFAERLGAQRAADLEAMSTEFGRRATAPAPTAAPAPAPAAAPAPADPRGSFDAKMQQAMATAVTDLKKANEMWAEVDKEVTDKAPAVFLFTPKHVDFVSKRLGNFIFNPQYYWMVNQSWVQ